MKTGDNTNIITRYIGYSLGSISSSASSEGGVVEADTCSTFVFSTSSSGVHEVNPKASNIANSKKIFFMIFTILMSLSEFLGLDWGYTEYLAQDPCLTTYCPTCSVNMVLMYNQCLAY